jgi:ubiquinone/menaquinone biosynthesis C-methylase UbiE
VLSRMPRAIGERPTDPVRAIAMQHLHLHQGDAVLDVGCGVGSFFPALRKAVGPGGRVVGTDFSPGMLKRAQRLVAAEGWTNIEVVQGDASRDSLGKEKFNAAVAVSSLSAMPDVNAAVQNVYQALGPGGRLFVFDVRLDPSKTARMPVKLLARVYGALAGATGADVLAALRQTFDAVEILPGSRETIIIAMAGKADSPQQPASLGVTGESETA